MDWMHRYTSPLGTLFMASHGESALAGLWFAGQKYFPESVCRLPVNDSLPVFRESDRWLDCYFSGKDPGFTPPLYLSASAFRTAVWNALLEIPYGETVSYGEIASRLAARTRVPRISARAVGGAVGHNPVSLIIPCHRVTGADGSLTGYAGGLERKEYLLRLERAVL